MFCRNCGNNLSSSAAFCTLCGNPIYISEQQLPPAPPPQPEYVPLDYSPKPQTEYVQQPYGPLSSQNNYLGNLPSGSSTWSENSDGGSGALVAFVIFLTFIFFIGFIFSLDDTSNTSDSYDSSEYTSSCCDIDLMVEHWDSDYSELSYVIYFDDSQRGSGTLSYGDSTWYSLCTDCSGSHTIEVYWGDGDDCQADIVLSNSDKSYGCTNY
jgi:hypothetical protein